ncbi:MAG: hypothetical protein C4K58_04480 [Flavobacteriaceae bacterium]|nr:MAG: hypothetical protein C4K58_04480 [Flavobacteriaceae bacterium]
MNKIYLFLFCFLFSGLSVYSQENKTTASIRLKTDGKKDQISLRWAVDEPLAWQKANKLGFELKRYTLSKAGSLLPVPEEKNLGVVKVAPVSEWKKIIEKNDNAAIVAQSLFGESFEVEMGKNKNKIEGIINKSEEVEQRFVYALMAADLDFEVAKMAGWGYVDKEVKNDEKYLYTVSVIQSAPTKTPLLIEKGSALAMTNQNPELPKPMDFIGIFQENTVTLSWEYLLLRETYTTYYIEKSEDKSPFKPMGDLPVVNMNDSGNNMAQAMVFVDSLSTNNLSYSYRIRGKTIFGDYGPYSDVVSGMGKRSLEASPRITHFDIDPQEKINITWDFPKEAEKDISSFELLYSPSDKPDSYKVIKDKIPITTRNLVTKSYSSSNYFKIQAIGKNTMARESFSILAQPNDSTPPEIPIQLKGEIDSLGVVRLNWKANTEKDLEGYHVFRGVQKSEELVRITPSAITENSFEDKVKLESLNSKVYYYITATDIRKNQSLPSEVLELTKPDKVKPQTPIFLSYTVENSDAVTLKWLGSRSEDVDLHQVYRKEKDSKEEAKLIYQTRNKSGEFTYTDTNLDAKKQYVYHLVAIDQNNLSSDKSPELWVVLAGAESQNPLKNLSGSANREKNQIELIWNLKDENVQEILVYKQKGAEKPTLFGTLQGNANFLEDKAVQSGNTYTYLLKPMLKNNQVAKTEKISVEY